MLLRFPGTDATVRIAPAEGDVTCFILDVPGAGLSQAACATPRAAPWHGSTPMRSSWSPGPGPEHPVVL